MKLDLVIRIFVTFDYSRGAMFTCGMHAASKYVGLTIIGAKHNPST